MKMLTSAAVYKKWLQAEVGRFDEHDYPAPLHYPCFAYMELESWGQETLRPIYLYQTDIDAMSIELLAAREHR